ncbi:putative ribonuclease H-like domain-containing protein [Tanacetum coccineum]
MQDELLQFKLQKVWTLVDLPYGKRAIGKNGVTKIQEIARIEAIRLFLAYASFMNFVVYQMDVKSAFLYGKIEEEVYVYQPLGFDDPEFLDRVYKVMQKEDGIFISQYKYVDEILKKFGFSTVRIATSRPDIMFAVCACVRFQVTPKVSHLYAVKRIFRYLKGQPKLGLWYPKDSPFDLEAYSDSDYAGASLDRKSTTGGCQFLGSRLISWQCKKQTIVANSTTEAEYVAAANCCGQVLWIQNQMLDYGYNFMNTKIFIDNESTICIVKNPVFHSKTKHIEIRHHFIRDSYEKRLIQVIKIHTDHNVADLLTKALDIKIVNNESQIRAKVNGKTIVITESFVRRDLHFNDEDGITCLTNTEIFENLQLMGYEKLFDKLTFYKSFFSPQWKYLIYTILQWFKFHKSTAWNEFGTNIASAVICLAKKQKFNFSKLIFDGMLRNLDPNSKKFLMYPRFLQLFLNNQIENLTAVFNDEYDTPSHTKKVFANMRRKGKDFSGTVTPLFATMLIQSQAVEGEGSGQPTEPQHTPTTASPSHVEPIPTIASSSQPKKTQKHRKTKRKATEISQSSGPTTLVADETVHEERGDSVERAATTATSLDAEQGSGNINRTQSTAIPNDPFPQGISSGGSPRRQDTMGDRPAQTRFERLSKQSNEPPLSRVNTLGSGEDSMKLQELMDLCTKLSDRVLDLENVKDAQALEIKKLKKRVKKLESKKKSRTPQLKRRLFKVRIESSAEKSLGDQEDASKQGRNEIDQDEGISWFQEDSETQGRYGHDIGVNTASTSITTTSINITTAEPVTTASAPITTVGVSISTAKPSTPPTTTTITPIEDEDLTIAQTLMKMKTLREFKQDSMSVMRLRRLQACRRGKRNKSEVDRAVLELAARSSKRYAEEELDKESSKRQKTDESSKLAEEPRDKEADELVNSESNLGSPKWGSVAAIALPVVIIPQTDVIGSHEQSKPTDDKERKSRVELKRLFEPDTDDEL